tara:strand:+ start:235 stop:609 length:375 start_codon:yes stop_codon:yes gene_type:complete
MCTAAVLEVVVVGLKNQNGDVHIAIYNTAEHFPYQEGVLQEAEAPILGNVARLKFKDLTPGAYAAAIYHDENFNHEFDQGLFGIPLEDYGFSNNATVFLSPPSFEEAMFEVKDPSTTVEIDINK